MLNPEITVLPAATMGSALLFARDVGATGVASAIENDMLGVNEPLALGVIQSALTPVEGASSDEERALLRAIIRFDDGASAENKSLFYKELLCPSLRLFSRTIDDALSGFTFKGKAVSPRTEAGQAPTEDKVLAFLKEAGTLGLLSGIQTAMFGPQAVDTAFSVIIGALRVVSDSGPSNPGAEVMAESITAFTAIRDPGAAKDAMPAYLRLISRYETFIDAVIGDDRQRQTKLSSNLYRRVDEFKLSRRAVNCLQYVDIKFIGELCQKTELEMLSLKNFGRKTLKELNELVEGLGLSLGMKLEGFSREDAESRSRP